MAPAARLIQRDRDQRAQLPLSHGSQREQWHLGNLVSSLLLLDREVADLRAVTVDDDYAPAFIYQLADRFGHGGRVGLLLGIRAMLSLGGKGVPAEGNYRGSGHGTSLQCGGHRRGIPTARSV